MECKADSCGDAKELYMGSTGLLGATGSLDGSREVAVGTARSTQLELGSPV